MIRDLVLENIIKYKHKNIASQLVRRVVQFKLLAVLVQVSD